jgi:DtxR family Mn-dependent transcriptional regulator
MRTRSRARQDYVKAIYALGGESAVVPTSALATALGVSPPSATNMLRRLGEDRLVALVPGRGARLSGEGLILALELVRRHRILETFLVRTLGLDWSEVHEDAEILEHHISDRVLEAIDRQIGHPTEDPHGHPIPDRAGRVRERRLSPLAALAAGQRGTVREIPDEDPARMGRWRRAGLVPGAAVRMRAVRGPEGIFEVEIGRRRFVTASEGLDGVMVEVWKEGRAGAAR